MASRRQSSIPLSPKTYNWNACASDSLINIDIWTRTCDPSAISFETIAGRFNELGVIDITCQLTDHSDCLFNALLTDNFHAAWNAIHDGVNPNLPMKNGMLPLVYTAMFGKNQMIILLLSYGARIDEYPYDGINALTIAALNGQLETCKLLHKLGSDINMRFADRTTPFYRVLTALSPNYEVMSWMIDYVNLDDVVPFIDSYASYVSRTDDINIIKLFLKIGVSVQDLGDYFGIGSSTMISSHPVRKAVISDRIELFRENAVKILFDKLDADPNVIIDIAGFTKEGTGARILQASSDIPSNYFRLGIIGRFSRIIVRNDDREALLNFKTLQYLSEGKSAEDAAKEAVSYASLYSWKTDSRADFPTTDLFDTAHPASSADSSDTARPAPSADSSDTARPAPSAVQSVGGFFGRIFG